ncbi:TPA: zf-HC2 domain-containing protein [Candidatus Poribacteria bacterium]|nr:zf-HC2 domain-containing protein [Candidatus Poribacteria bacterium]
MRKEVDDVKCSTVRKNLSAFLDNELDTRTQKQVDEHLSECADCQYELKRLREVAYQFRGLSVPEVTQLQWDETRRKLMSNIDSLPHKFRWFRLPVFIPVGAFVILLIVFGIFITYNHNESSLISIDVCYQEHALSTSTQKVPPDIFPDFAIADSIQTVSDSDSDGDKSDIDMLLEAHYGVI